MSDLVETLELLLEHHWLFQFPVTEILVRDTLSRFPEGWRESLINLTIEELNDLVTGRFIDEKWNSSLTDFVEKCREIKGKLSEDAFLLSSEASQRFSQLTKHLTLGLNPKKQHEALHLAQLTHELCYEEGLDVIVDLGCGLGYVCQILHHLFGYKILGLESSPSITKSANQRQDTLHPLSKSSINYHCLKVTENSSEEIENLVNPLTKTDICLIGLHSCGDLSTNALKLFKNMKRAKLLVMMSCCYHKIEYSEDKKSFKNFPMSEKIRENCEKTKIFDDFGDFFGRPFLRLACQESSERWKDMQKKDHDQHALLLMARGVVELFCQKNDISLTKMRRKSARASQCSDFKSYIKNFVERYEFNGKNSHFYEEIEEIWRENEGKLFLAEVFTGLQLLLQAPAEFLVLGDRRQWLVEQGFPQTRIVSVLDKKLSPRSHAIVSKR